MNYLDVKRQIMNNTLENFYIFTGNEQVVRSAYIKKIAEISNSKVIQIDNVFDIKQTRGMSFIQQKYCYVSNDPSFIKSESNWDKIEVLIGGNILIYVPLKLEKRTKFYKHFEDKVVEFDYMHPEILKKHIREQIDLCDNYCDRLIQICERDYGRLLLNIDLLDNYKQATNKTYDDCFKCLIENGVLYQPPTDAIFEWVETVLAGRPRAAFRLLQNCQELGEPSLRLLLVLYNSIKHLLQVQSCDSKDVSKATGLSQWEINNVRDYKGIYSNRELVACMKNIREMEIGIKQGLVDESISVENVLVNLF